MWFMCNLKIWAGGEGEALVHPHTILNASVFRCARGDVHAGLTEELHGGDKAVCDHFG